MVEHLITIFIAIFYMNSQFPGTLNTLAMKTLHDVYFIASNNLIYICNMYKHILFESTNQITVLPF